MNPVAFQIFGQHVYWYGIFISLGVLLGIFLALRNAKIFEVDQDSIVDLALIAIPLAIIGARLYYVIFEWNQYKGNLLDIFNIRKGGLAIYGGVIGGAMAGLFFARWKKHDFWNLADICAPSIILGQAIGRWGNYINQEAYGYAVNNPEWQWFPAAVFIDTTQQWHWATFFYESFWNLIVFFILMSYRKHRKKTGEVFLLYLILYSVGRFFIEGLRTDSLYIGMYRVSQLLSAVLFMAGIVLIVYRRKHSRVVVPETDVLDRTKTMEEYPLSENEDGISGDSQNITVKEADHEIDSAAVETSEITVDQDEADEGAAEEEEAPEHIKVDEKTFKE